MRLNRSTSHAMRILIECAQAEDDLVKVADLSARLDITVQNVFKIVHILSHAGLIAAQRGRHGGVRLTRAAADIRIGDVVRAMEATALEIDSHGTGDAVAADGASVAGVNRVLDSALEAFIDVLDQHTLADMAGRGRATDRPRRAKPSVASRTRRSVQPASKSRNDTVRPRR